MMIVHIDFFRDWTDIPVAGGSCWRPTVLEYSNATAGFDSCLFFLVSSTVVEYDWRVLRFRDSWDVVEVLSQVGSRSIGGLEGVDRFFSAHVS